jgi:hypothetical protein
MWRAAGGGTVGGMASVTEENDHLIGTGTLMALFLLLALGVGLVSITAQGWTGSSTNPTVTLPAATPCTTLNNSYQTLQSTLQAYQFGTATQADVTAAMINFHDTIVQEIPNSPVGLRQALQPLPSDITATLALLANPQTPNRFIANQSQQVVNAATFIPRLCPLPDEH